LLQFSKNSNPWCKFAVGQPITKDKGCPQNQALFLELFLID